MSVVLRGPEELARAIAGRARGRRLALNLSQEGLAMRAGVSLGTLKKFERTGEIALVSLLRLAHVLDATRELEMIFQEPEFKSLDEVVDRDAVRRRGRRK